MSLAIFQNMAEDDFKMMQQQGMLNDDRSVNLDHEEVRKIECGSATYVWGAFSPELNSRNGDFLRCGCSVRLALTWQRLRHRQRFPGRPLQGRRGRRAALAALQAAHSLIPDRPAHVHLDALPRNAILSCDSSFVTLPVSSKLEHCPCFRAFWR